MKEFRYLALGDSYTKGESIPFDKSFPAQLKERLFQHLNAEKVHLEVIAETGWTTTDLKKAISLKNPDHHFDLVTLLIGVNNQYQGKSIKQYQEEFAELLRMSIAFAKGDKKNVLVISIPDYGYSPFGKNNQAIISKQIEAFNDSNKKIADSMHIAYANITDISKNGLSDSDLLASDGLHPSGKMYALWLDIILKKINK